MARSHRRRRRRKASEPWMRLDHADLPFRIPSPEPALWSWRFETDRDALTMIVQSAASLGLAATLRSQILQYGRGVVRTPVCRAVVFFRLSCWIVCCFGLLLAASGCTAFFVFCGARTREIGIRMALAPPELMSCRWWRGKASGLALMGIGGGPGGCVCINGAHVQFAFRSELDGTQLPRPVDCALFSVGCSRLYVPAAVRPKSDP